MRQSWLAYGGLTRLLCGMSAHRRWHYAGPAGQPSRFVRWFCRSVDAPKTETLTNLWHSLVACVTHTKPPWTLEAEEAEAEALESHETITHYPHHDHAHAPHGQPVDSCAMVDGDGAATAKEQREDVGEDEGHAPSVRGHSVHSVTSSMRSAMRLRTAKRRLTALGLSGVYMVWCVPDNVLTCLFAHPKPCVVHARSQRNG
jgi:hypothetical protein